MVGRRALAERNGRNKTFDSAGNIATGWGTERWGRKPLLLVAFAVLPVRGVLRTLTSRPTLLIAVQVLDGIGAVRSGVIAVLVIADLAQGAGRFNLAQSIVLSLAVIAAVATAMFWLLMPETRDAARADAASAPTGTSFNPARLSSQAP